MFNYKVFVAELIGSFALVFIGAAIGMYNAGLLAVALAHGLTWAVFIYAFGHISGAHLNPAVTFGQALNGTVKWGEAVVYWVAQFAGGVLAAFALNAVIKVVSPEAFRAAQTIGVLTEEFPYYALAVEALLTFFLVNSFLHASARGKDNPWAGLANGTTLVIAMLAGLPLTGASLNPMRTFGPAVVAGAANNGMMYLIYFAGPFAGAILAVGLYKLLSIDISSKPEPVPAVVEAPVEEPEESKPRVRKPAKRKTTKKS